ncbi:hypothetical protein TRIATDRAFT_132869 [Trichoderma atroviride IMI 206040]|uniref:DUF7896 domain-containing protein n=1 Tax=Hypocrea atroviridis (strain ATCC 20476 / IMI 206040) TaxID=452589 RepID=G9NR89_HYPAI|nr:uncharacterized protein TRIATDRAFT_132869 [Trichoderma atroviride IMI 206040]EHK47057.1 hypothetical protein TRIATDRAFT_132869 [Trichoderma atroviride IMI 206040]
MPELNFNWQLMDFPTEQSPRSAGQQSQPTLSAQNMRMQPVAPRVQVPNYQLTGSNAADMDRTPTLNRALGANAAFAPFEPANNRNGYPPQLQTALAFPMQRNASIHSEFSMPLQDLQGQLPLASIYHPHSNERLSSVPLRRVNERSVSLNSLDIGIHPGTYLSTTGISLSRDDMPSHNVPSAPPSMVSTSSVAEDSWHMPMTRENSRVQASPNMHRMPSFSSFKEEPHLSQGAFDYSQPSSPRKASDLNNDLLAIGNGIVPSLNQYASLESLFPSSASMERENSNISIKSTKSTASNVERRLKEATERVIQNSKATAIAPMPQQLPPNAATSIAPKKERALQEGDKNKPKPKPPKLCPHCVEYPNGFRGDHELRRHIKAKHRRTVKKWICRDPAELRIPSELRALYPLAKCKACASGKLYGAYYNAAAHLRRTHFTAKPTRARGASAGRRNGGRGGGDWPPMKQLKLWFREVTVEGDETSSLAAAYESPDKRSPSLAIEEVPFMPVGQLDDTDAFRDIFSPDIDFGLIDYEPQSIDAALGLNMMVSGLDNDIEMASSSQDSLVASVFQDAYWPVQEPYGQ